MEGNVGPWAIKSYVVYVWDLSGIERKKTFDGFADCLRVTYDT